MDQGICFQANPKWDSDSSPQPLFGSKAEEEVADEIWYRLTLAGSLAVHPQTTMAMLPWVVAEIRNPRLKDKRTPEIRDHLVVLRISCSSVRCTLDVAGEGGPWDPLQHTTVFQQRPHRITRLIHNSCEPSYFGCLIQEETSATCYVFCCHDQHKVSHSD